MRVDCSDFQKLDKKETYFVVCTCVSLWCIFLMPSDSEFKSSGVTAASNDFPS